MYGLLLSGLDVIIYISLAHRLPRVMNQRALDEDGVCHKKRGCVVWIVTEMPKCVCIHRGALLSIHTYVSQVPLVIALTYAHEK